MDSFAQKDADDKLAYIVATADALGLSSVIVEKDFWVCWTLNRIFESNLKNSVIFKGGTSLSKVYHLIERFSEDIDISISKEVLGFGEEKSPEEASSNKQTRKRLDALGAKCREFVGGQCKLELESLMETHLPRLLDWSLGIDPDDIDQQSLLFHYPKAIVSESSGYIRQSIKIEFGARSDHWPANTVEITSFIAENFPTSMASSNVPIKALSAERTFWEKATILHSFSHFPEGKKIPLRQSRHYYDFFKLLQSTVRERAEKELILLARVVTHKRIYFRSAWARYDSAVKGSLRLIPVERVLKEMERDYKAMSDMFYGEVPTWAEIVEGIAKFEEDFNHDNLS